MQLPQVNYLAVLVAGLVIFLIGGLWYSHSIREKMDRASGED